jgi:hypothetical protein
MPRATTTPPHRAALGTASALSTRLRTVAAGSIFVALVAACSAAPGADQPRPARGQVASWYIVGGSGSDQGNTGPVATSVGATPVVPAAVVPPELIGSWYNGTVSSIDFYTPSTGGWDNAGGTGTSYTFNADGTYEFGWLLQSTLYGCSTHAMVWKAGFMTVDVAQHRIDLVPSQAKIHSVDDCSESGNYDRDIDRGPETVYWDWSQDEYGNAYLALRYPDGAYSAFYPFTGA